MIRLDADKRATREALRREIRLLEKPAKDVDRKKARLERRERVKAIGTPAKGQRQPRVREPLFLAWLRRLPCVAGLVKGGCSGPIEAAHLRYSDANRGRVNPGLQCKPSDRHCTPLCNGHHQSDQHKRAERAFWDDLGIEPGALTDALHAAYAAGQDGLAVLRAFSLKES
jgi:hypothetical protein